MRLPGSISFTRSIMSIGKRCGRCSSTSWMSISAMFFSFAPTALLAFQAPHPLSELCEVAHERRIARPRGVIVEREHPRVGAGLEDRARDHGGRRDVHAVDELQVDR